MELSLKSLLKIQKEEKNYCKDHLGVQNTIKSVENINMKWKNQKKLPLLR